VPGSLARLIELALADAAGPHARPEGTSALIALGWATVDLDRAIPEIGLGLGLSADAFVQVVDSAILGARGRVAQAAIGGTTSLVILEPSTEGRLAAALARYGEGPIAVWFHADQGANRPGGPVREEQPGPFGPERLVSGGLVRGLYRFLVLAEPGTIRP
jgi:hypothetical protein